MEQKDKKVIVAMSGGVDGSVAAALLKKQGHDVVGIFMLMHEYSNPTDAKQIAKKLDIPFYVLDVRKEFKKRVVDYFIKEYKKGNTPNPCVECNKWIKFKFLFEKATLLRVDYITTGHYARIKFVNSKKIRYSLIVAKDIKKDQSYFLWTLNKKQLSKIIFPIGDYTKEQVRGLAKKWGLPVFEKKDSQEICFVSADLRGFLESRIHAERGPIITTDGKKVGEHKGLVFYTIGQRKGIEIGGTGPYYVIRKDFKNNTLIVSKSEKDLLQKEMVVKNVNFISKPNKFPIKCKVKIRSMTKMVPCALFKIQNGQVTPNLPKFKILFSAPQRAITPGQSAVFYKGNEVLGGGIIIN